MSWRGHEGTGHTVANFYVIYVKFFDWKFAFHAGNAVEKNKNWHFTAFKIVKFPLSPNMVGVIFPIYFFSQTLTIHRTAGEGEAVFLIPLYHFHLLHRYVSRVIPA